MNHFNRALPGIVAFWTLSLATSVPLGAENLRIGIVDDLGDRTPASKALSYSVALAVEDSRRLGLLPTSVAAVTVDDLCRPDIAADIARKFIQQDRVHLVIGHTCTSTSLIASRIYRENGLLLINPTTTAPILTAEQQNRPATVFRLAERQDRAAAVASVILHSQIKGKNICLVGDASRKAWLDRFQTISAGNSKKIFIEDSIPKRSASTDLCIVYGNEERSGLDRIGDRDDVIGVSGIDDRFLNAPKNTDQIKTFAVRLRAAGYSGPIGPAVNAYAAVQIWAKAMQEARTSEPIKVTEQLHRLKFETIRGLVSFDEGGDVRQPLITIVRYSNPIIQVPNQCNEPACRDCKCDGCCPK